MQSHPTWVRGLKHKYIVEQSNRCQSHPTWVRGLKHPKHQQEVYQQQVAPYVGAWIETVAKGASLPAL